METSTKTSTTETDAAAGDFSDSLEFVQRELAALVREAETSPSDLLRMVDHPDHIPLLREIVLTKVTSPDCERRRCVSRRTTSKGRIDHLYPRCDLANCPHCAPRWITQQMHRVFQTVGDGQVYRYRLSTRAYGNKAGKARKAATVDAGGSWVKVNVGHDDVEFFSTHNPDGKGEPVDAPPAILDALLRAPLRAGGNKRVQPVSFPKPSRAVAEEAKREKAAAKVTAAATAAAVAAGDLPDVLCRRAPSWSTIEGLDERFDAALGYSLASRRQRLVNRRGGPYSQMSRVDGLSTQELAVYEDAMAPLFREALEELDAMHRARKAKALYSQFEMFQQAYPQRAQTG